MTSTLDHHPMDPDLHQRLRHWVSESLITPQEADAIEEFESRTATPAAGTGADLTRRVPLVTEALAYLGIALAAAAGAVVVGQRWEDMSPEGRAISVGVAAAVTFIAGYLLRRSEEPAFARLMSVLWLISTGLLAGCAALVAYDILGYRGRVPLAVAGGVTTAFALALYVARPCGGQQLGLFAGLLMLAGTVSTDPSAVATALWAMGVAWTIVGGLGWIRPKRAAFIVGPFVALWAPFAILGGGGDYGMWLGLVTGVALIAASIPLHETVLLGFGVVGSFVFLMRVVMHLFRGTVGVPIALVVTGAAVLVVAIVLARRATRTPPRPVG